MEHKFLVGLREFYCVCGVHAWLDNIICEPL